MKTKSTNDNVVSLETRVALLEQKTINIEVLISDIKNGMTRMETKMDNLFLHFDRKFDVMESKSWNRFIILSGMIISVFLILGKEVYGL